jgi:hypothetical protein
MVNTVPKWWWQVFHIPKYTHNQIMSSWSLTPCSTLLIWTRKTWIKRQRVILQADASGWTRSPKARTNHPCMAKVYSKYQYPANDENSTLCFPQSGKRLLALNSPTKVYPANCTQVHIKPQHPPTARTRVFATSTPGRKHVFGCIPRWAFALPSPAESRGETPKHIVSKRVNWWAGHIQWFVNRC